MIRKASFSGPPAPGWGAIQVPIRKESEELKHGYITYGKWTPEFRALTPEERKKEFDRIKKEAEKHGFKMLLWGHPFGVSEQIVVVYESEKGLEEYFGMDLQNPYTDSRTNIVAIP